jgi:TolB-like protein
MVRLLKADGTFEEVEVSALCQADQDYIKRQRNPSKVPEVPKPTVMDPKGATPPSSTADPTQFNEKCQKLCEDLTKSYAGGPAGRKAKIAVLEFPDLSGNVSPLGQLLPEELLTKFFATGKYTIVERLLLKKVMAEHKLAAQGFVDQRSAKELGKLVGADVIACGTVADARDVLRVNARLFSTETGEVVATAAASIMRDKFVEIILGGDRGTESIQWAEAAEGPIKRFPFRDDLRLAKDGEPTAWGSAGRVVTGPDNRKWLRPAEGGQRAIGRKVDLPDNAYIEFDYEAVELQGKGRRETVLSGITLVDEAGAKFRVEFTVWMTGERWSAVQLKIPGGASVYKDCYDATYSAGTLRIHKAGDRITINREGLEAMTANVGDFKNFVKFELDLYRGQNCMICFTDFRIGKSEAASNRRRR